LGNAFLAQQQGVMDAVQRLRKKAQDAGALQSSPQQTVSTVTENNQPYIEIQPTSTEVVYVPQYNPVAVWGPPPEYYPYPPIYYPPYSPGAVVAASAISFGVGMAVGAFWGGGGGWNNWGWNAGWGRNNVVINNNFINNNHFNRVNVANGNNWVHNPSHRGGVPYNNRNVSNRFQGAGAGNRPMTRRLWAKLSNALTSQVGAEEASASRARAILGNAEAARGSVEAVRERVKGVSQDAAPVRRATAWDAEPLRLAKALPAASLRATWGKVALTAWEIELCQARALPTEELSEV
jgi:hypothetical protein